MLAQKVADSSPRRIRGGVRWIRGGPEAESARVRREFFLVDFGGPAADPPVSPPDSAGLRRVRLGSAASPRRVGGSAAAE